MYRKPMLAFCTVHVITKPDIMLYACMFLLSVSLHITQRLNGVGMSTIITSVAFATVTHYTLI